MSTCAPSPFINNSDNHEPPDRSHRLVYYTCLASMLGDMNLSMLIAFFPKECMQRGLQLIHIGILFGIFHLFALLSCLISPKILKKLPSSSLFTVGTFAQAVVTFAFGFTDRLEQPLTFFLACAGIRTVQGILAGICEVASMDLIKRRVSPNRINESVAWVESAKTLGVMIGPVLGGALCKKFDFRVPFMVLGSVILGVAFLMIIVPFDKDNDRLREPTSNWEYTKIVLKSPIVIMLMLVIVLAASSITFFEPTLQPFMAKRPLYLDEVEVGLIYLTLILVYGFTAGLSGVIASCVGNLASFCFGLFCLGLGYCIMAPSKILKGPLSAFSFLYQADSSKAVIVVVSGICLIGSGAGICLSPMNAILVNESMQKGISSTDSMLIISSMVNIGFTFGATIGPVAGAALVQALDFQRASVLFGYCVIASSFFVTACIACIGKCRHNDDGSTMYETMEESLLTVRASHQPHRGRYLDTEPDEEA